MRRMKRGGDDEASLGGRILELNPGHPVVDRLRSLFEGGEGREQVADWARLLYEQAVIAEGSRLPDPASFAERVNRLLLSELEKDKQENKET